MLNRESPCKVQFKCIPYERVHLVKICHFSSKIQITVLNVSQPNKFQVSCSLKKFICQHSSAYQTVLKNLFNHPTNS